MENDKGWRVGIYLILQARNVRAPRLQNERVQEKIENDENQFYILE